MTRTTQYLKVDIKKVVEKRDKRFDPNRNIVPAIVVAVNGETSPANRPNMTWVDEYGVGSNYCLAWNTTGITDAGVPVLVAKSPKPPFERTILDVNLAMLNQGNQGNTNVSLLKLPRHAPSHQWPEGNPGRDVVRLYQPAMMQLRTYPTTGLFVAVYRLIYRLGNTTEEFLGQLVDLTASVPGAGLIRRVLLYLDKSTGTILTIDGTPVLDNGIIPVPSPDIPDDAIPSADVLLVGAQTTIVEADIVDRREYLERGESDLPTPTEIGQVLFSVTPSQFTVELPLTGPYGWLVNSDGILLVVG